ncbi:MULTISPECIES: hypothetical protein [Streptomyces]|uniref:hypothetical protein n=1 Tax=Streptomyces TaxID=1883 RepID=UPI000374ADC6|nr:MULTISPECIES: hypothetical protein [Streptomyces]MCY0982589.1 hypothetical protein [Streptomyces tirandamycinicus]NNJ04576.1 hypothetical protein [Streptomyces sp. PKU-MA01144]
MSTGHRGRSGRVREPVRLDRTKGGEPGNVMSQPTFAVRATGGEQEKRVDGHGR